MAPPGTDTWTFLSLVCNTTSTLWEWIDGTELDYKPAKYDSLLDQDCKDKCSWDLKPDGSWYVNSDAQSTKIYNVHTYCTTQLEQPVAAPDGCDSFEDDSEDGICYQVGTNAENWQGAQTVCKQLGANLASIHNQQENSFIRRLAVSKGSVNGVFLGGTVSGKGYDFQWIDGTPWDYDHFHPGFPKTGYGDCLAMDTSNSSGFWMNMECEADLPVACIRDQKEVVTPTCTNDSWAEGVLITSPGFPYSANTFCDYFLTVDVGKKVEVIIDLEANSCCDYLTIYEGQLGGSLIANLTGQVRSAVYKTTTSNIMRVNWQPNGGVNVRGLVMSFKGVLH